MINVRTSQAYRLRNDIKRSELETFKRNNALLVFCTNIDPMFSLNTHRHKYYACTNIMHSFVKPHG